MTPSVETGKDIVGHRFTLKILLIHLPYLPSTRPLTSSLSSHPESLLLSQVSLLPLHVAHQPASVRDTLLPTRICAVLSAAGVRRDAACGQVRNSGSEKVYTANRSSNLPAATDRSRNARADEVFMVNLCRMK
jgi:hypothetical protein